MNKKKLVCCAAFLVLILLTAAFFLYVGIKGYYQETQQYPDDKFAGFIAVAAFIIGGSLMLYEADLFCTVYYFAFKQKRTVRTVVCVLANLCLALYFYFLCVPREVWIFGILRKYEMIPLILFALFALLRIAFFLIPSRLQREDQEQN